MGKMWAPVSVRRDRFRITKPSSNVTGLQYLLRNLKQVALCDKYIMERNVLVLDVTKNSCKKLITRAISSVDPDNKVLKVNSLVRKSTSRTFRGTTGSLSAYKRMYIRFEKAIDPKLFSDQIESEEA